MKTIFKLSLCVALMAFCFVRSFGQNTGSFKKGILDLRNDNIGTDFISLSGEWFLYYNKLLSPAEISASSGTITQYPALWMNLKENGKPLSSIGYATYSLTVLLPSPRPAMAMRVPDTYSSYKLFLNGKVISQNGEPATTEEKATPFWATKVVELPDADTLSLVLQVANFWHYKGGTYKDIVIGEKTGIFLKHKRDTAFDLLLAGCLFMGGLFFLGLFSFSRHDKPILYFSLFCIIYSYRLIGTQHYVLHEILPDLPWSLTIHLEYLALVLGVGCFGKYIELLYPLDTSRLLLKIQTLLCFLYAGIIVIFPPMIFTPLITTFLIIMFFYIGYAFYVFVKAYRNKRSGSVFALWSSGVLLLIFLLINLEYFSIIPPFKAFIFALYITFFFLQSLVLSHRFSDRLKQAAVHAQQGLRARAEFLSTMSHEIRTPLNSVIGMAHLLKRSEPRKDQQENLDVLMFSANNLLSIVNNILDYNKIEAGKINFEQTSMDLPALARNIVAGLNGLANEKRICLLLDIDEKITRKVTGDPTRTGQVLNNLVHNAIKFTPKGEVKLILKVDTMDDLFMTVTISIKDTGIGIAPEKHKLIFERFTQADSSTSRSYGGTGLGLSISKRILELQGSGLQLESTPGEGSCFFFTQTYPLLDEKVESLKNDEPAESELNGHANEINILRDIDILLVEDNPMNVLVAQTFLERCGARIDVATNGQEAIDQFDSKRHKLILMDLDMPIMDGYEATQHLRSNGETVPVIALTASLPAEVENEVYSAGLTDIMVKPFNPDDLYRMILSHITAQQKIKPISIM